MKTQVQLELQDYLNAQKLHMRKSNFAFVLLGVVLILYVLVSLIMVLLYGAREYATYILIVLIPVGAVLLFRYVLLGIRFQEDIGRPFGVTGSSTGLAGTGDFHKPAESHVRQSLRKTHHQIPAVFGHLSIAGPDQTVA